VEAHLKPPHLAVHGKHGRRAVAHPQLERAPEPPPQARSVSWSRLVGGCRCLLGSFGVGGSRALHFLKLLFEGFLGRFFHRELLRQSVHLFVQSRRGSSRSFELAVRGLHFVLVPSDHDGKEFNHVRESRKEAKECEGEK
jgi:hypothetical protein